MDGSRYSKRIGLGIEKAGFTIEVNPAIIIFYFGVHEVLWANDVPVENCCLLPLEL